MTTITITATKATTPTTLAPGVTYAATAYVVVDNSGATLPAGTLNGSESPPWTATLTGASGPSEASVTFTDLDTNGNTIGTPVVVTESGTGGVTGTFLATTGGTITVA
jgi:hypothetical protein